MQNLPLLNWRHASLNDVADLSAIRAACFDKLWIDSTFAEMLQRPEIVCLIIPDIAYVLAQKILPEAEIITIAVMPDRRRMGIAEKMLREICQIFVGADIHTLHLEVSEKLPAARALYEKIGFVPSGRRPRYYVSSSGETADAILMRLDLPV